MTTALAAALRLLAGPDLAVVVRKLQDPAEPLWATEQPAMVRAIPARIAEFAAGRTAARAAMQALGLPKAAIPMGPDRAPVWPAGLVGSISHSAGFCAALVARTGAITGIGVDLEPDDPLGADLWPEVCGSAELTALGQMPKVSRGRTAKLIFSAKECTYKCIYPQIQTVLGFAALDIRLDQPSGVFDATLLHPAEPFTAGAVWRGKFALIQGLIATVLVLR